MVVPSFLSPRSIQPVGSYGFDRSGCDNISLVDDVHTVITLNDKSILTRYLVLVENPKGLSCSHLQAATMSPEAINANPTSHTTGDNIQHISKSRLRYLPMSQLGARSLTLKYFRDMAGGIPLQERQLCMLRPLKRSRAMYMSFKVPTLSLPITTIR